MPPSNRETGHYEYTPTPNQAIQEGLYRGSKRSSHYNPSVNPMSMAGRTFGEKIKGDASLWGQETGLDGPGIAERQAWMFRDYMDAEAEGVGEEYIQRNVPERLRHSFGRAARQGANTFERVVGFAQKVSPSGVTEYFDNLESNPDGPNPEYNHPVHGTAAR